MFLHTLVSNNKFLHACALACLKSHRQISKNGVSKSIAHVIKHTNFQFYKAHSDKVIWKN